MKYFSFLGIAITLHLTTAALAQPPYTLIAFDSTQVIVAEPSDHGTLLHKSEYDPQKQRLLLSENGGNSVQLVSEPDKPSNALNQIHKPSPPRILHRPSTPLAPLPNMRAATLSPNGKLAVAINQEGNALFLEDIESGRMDPVFTHHSYVVGPWWSWEGDNILFFTAKDHTSTHTGGYILRSYNLRTKATIDLTPPSLKTALTFYPKLAAMKQWVVFSTILTEKSDAARQVYAIDPMNPNSLIRIDDTWIISLTTVVDGDAVLLATKEGCFLLRESGGVFSKGKLESMPATWTGFRFRLSPDSQRMAFLQSGDLVLGDMKTGKLEVIAKKFTGDFHWSPTPLQP